MTKPDWLIALHNLYVDVVTLGIPVMKKGDAYFTPSQKIGSHPILSYWKDGVLLPYHAMQNVYAIKQALSKYDSILNSDLPPIIKPKRYSFILYSQSMQVNVSVITSSFKDRLAMMLLKWRFPIVKEYDKGT